MLPWASADMGDNFMKTPKQWHKEMEVATKAVEFVLVRKESLKGYAKFIKAFRKLSDASKLRQAREMLLEFATKNGFKS